LLWKSSSQVLVAAGTAFGEIIYWSWTRQQEDEAYSCIHRVFLGHEGSIFGVRISAELNIAGKGRRYLASCSDDRTIRVWDLSDISTSADAGVVEKEQQITSRNRHTGFSNAAFDADTLDSPCLAIGWGHYSRIWAVHFLESQLPDTVSLLSSGEDATSRTWQFVPDGRTIAADSNTPISLTQTGIAAYHSGKNIWSTTLFGSALGSQRVVCGGADSKITAYALPPVQRETKERGLALNEYTVEDILAMSSSDPTLNLLLRTAPVRKTAKQGNSFRGYAFVDDKSFLLITNAGKIFLIELSTEPEADGAQTISNSTLVDQLDELSNYAVCTGDSSLGIGLAAGSRGGIYLYRKQSAGVVKLHAVQGKVGGLFIGQPWDSTNPGKLTLLVTLMGQRTANLIYLDITEQGEYTVWKNVEIEICESATGATITSMAYIPNEAGEDHIVLGFRGGSIAAYDIPGSPRTKETCRVSPSSIVKVHGKEAVTSLLWHPSPSNPAVGHLTSAGRDGCCAIHAIDLSRNKISLVHNLPLPVGPNLEGIYFHQDRLIMYGFSSTKFIVYDITHEEEIMSVETGGSHRSWSFRPNPSSEGGGTLVWTRAATMHVYTQNVASHTVIRSGGHGREIKDVAITQAEAGEGEARTLIATGAEDTDIKIFEYIDNDFKCRRTLRKHITGIQHLQWSSDSQYLFSSGGCEEFFVWRICSLPSFMGIGVVCEAVCPLESELPDVRVMSFDVLSREDDRSGFLIALVFSDSVIKVYDYNPAELQKWQLLAKGVYFTSCLTQCVFLSPTFIFTAGTDGHAVLWPLGDALQDSNSTNKLLTWRKPTRIHQNTSKSLSTHCLDNGSTLLVSGGDDGSLAFLLACQDGESYTHPPLVVVRTHASAVTACAVVPHRHGKDGIYVLTSGNDQWIRLWEVQLGSATESDPLTVKCAKKIKTNVADVSSMAVLGATPTGSGSRVVICGVGMEVVCLD
jgi:WD40 repeat protein